MFRTAPLSMLAVPAGAAHSRKRSLTRIGSSAKGTLLQASFLIVDERTELLQVSRSSSNHPENVRAEQTLLIPSEKISFGTTHADSRTATSMTFCGMRQQICTKKCRTRFGPVDRASDFRAAGPLFSKYHPAWRNGAQYCTPYVAQTYGSYPQRVRGSF
jgi:hypothetical protein